MLVRGDWDLFRSTIAGEIGGITESSVEAMAQGIDRVLKKAADISISKRKANNGNGKNVWWSSELISLCKNLVRAKRLDLRMTDRQRYNNLRNEFLATIRSHKPEVWKVFAGDLNRNP